MKKYQKLLTKEEASEKGRKVGREQGKEGGKERGREERCNAIIHHLFHRVVLYYCYIMQ